MLLLLALSRMLLLRLTAPWLLLLGVLWSEPSAVDGAAAGGGGGGGQAAEFHRGQTGTSRDRAAAASARTAEPAPVKHRRGLKSLRKTLETSSSETQAAKRLFLRERRSSLTHAPLGHTHPQAQTGPAPSAFEVRFHKCAQMKRGSDPPEVSFFLLIHNVASSALASNLSQVSVRDSISGIVPVQSEGREVERGFQSFTIDALHAGSQVVLNYSARIMSTKSGVLELPAFLTFSNASQNDVNMFGPLTANLTLRINTSDRVWPNHVLHAAGFVGGFLLSLGLAVSGFLLMNWIDPSLTLRFCQKRRSGGSKPEFADCDGSADNLKDEAALENKMVDVMLLEEPQNMAQALESLEMSSLLHASNHLEAARLQIHKALLVALLSQEGRLLEVVQGQVMAAEGRIKEQLGAKMAALATRCNRETREALEAELHRQRKEQERAERLCQRAEPQNVLQCSLLLEKLHSLSQSRMQRHLLVRHEEASARVQREITEQRRAELHMIFSEELEEATRLGEMNHSTSASLLHHYCTCQDLLEDTLDEVVAHQRLVLAERQAQRSFLVQSLQSIHSLISETFNSCSRALDDWLCHVRGLGRVPAEQLEPLCDRAQQQVALLRQRLKEALTEEKRALRCGLLQRRRERLSDMYCVHRQQLKVLSSSPLPLDEAGLLQMFERWRNVLVCQFSEVSELVKHLDEEAAADIRKLTTRLLEGTATELRAIQPSLAQSLQAAFPPGERHLLQTGHTAPTQDPAQTDRLQQEAQMGTTREQLQGALQRELSEQRDTRDKCRAFFRRLCSCQLALSEADLLQMKLEFHKCFCVMDRCLVLPPAVHRAKLHCALEEWSSQQEALMTRGVAKGKKPGSELQCFQKSLQERVSLLEKLTARESGLRDQVWEQMQLDRQTSLHSQACVLSSRLISGQLEKVQRRSRALQTWTALVSLQSLLIPELAQRDNMADVIHAHKEGLAAAEEQFHRDLSSLLDSSQSGVSDCERGLFQLQPDCRMESILQEALHKREQLLCAMAHSCERWMTHTQATQELKERLETRRLQQLLHQELQFVCELVKLSEVPPDILRETLRLLLPSLPESELLSVTEALCPKQSSGSSSTWNDGLAAKLREDVIRKAAGNTPTCTEQTDGMDERRRVLLQKLLPLVRAPPPLKIHPDETRPSDRPSPSDHGDDPTVRLFVFRDPPPPLHVQTPGGAARKRKRNFLNFKKNSVVPTNAP